MKPRYIYHDMESCDRVSIKKTVKPKISSFIHSSPDPCTSKIQNLPQFCQFSFFRFFDPKRYILTTNWGLYGFLPLQVTHK